MKPATRCVAATYSWRWFSYRPHVVVTGVQGG